MKKVFVLLSLLFFTSIIGTAQSIKSVIKEIKKDYKEITNNVDSYSVFYSNILNESTEGGEQKKYTNHKEYILVVAELYGETGNTFTNYYFKNEELFFVFEKQATYNRPIYYDKEYALEEGDKEYFDSKKTTFTKNRYYFNNQQLIRWLDTSKKEVDISSDEAKNKGISLLEYAQKALKR